MTHAERRTRREQIFREYKSGVRRATLADKYGLTIHSIDRYCRGRGAELFHSVNSFRVLYLALTTDFSYTQIGEELHITKQRVEQILRRAREAGFDLSKNGSKP